MERGERALEPCESRIPTKVEEREGGEQGHAPLLVLSSLLAGRLGQEPSTQELHGLSARLGQDKARAGQLSFEPEMCSPEVTGKSNFYKSHHISNILGEFVT